MNAIKTTGFLRIWKAILFTMIMILFAACFGNTALAASSWTFNYTGNVQSWTCPVTGMYKLEAWGAQGGNSTGPQIGYTIFGGQGGYASGVRQINKGETLYLAVGGQGDTVTNLVAGGTRSWLDITGKSGGYNGGGRGGDGARFSGWNYFAPGAGGGGATHIATTNRGVLSNYSSCRNELLIVAGGGGGAGGWNGGGTGGGNEGQSVYNRNNSASGGTQSSGYSFGIGAPGDNGRQYGSVGDSSVEGRGGGGGGWYGGARCTTHSNADFTNLGGAGGSGHLGNVQNGSMANGQRSGNGFARITAMHTHNSSGTEYNQGNDSQHIKYTYCNEHGSDHSLNRNATLENHTWTTTKDWYNYDNTTMHQEQKCTLCGRTRVNSKTRTYWVNISVLDPDNVEHTAASTGIGYFRVSNDGINWSDLYYDQPDTLSYIGYAEYGSKIYIQYVKSATPTLEFKAIKATYNCLLSYLTSTGDLEKHQLTGGSDLTKVGDNTWVYTVTNDTVNGMTSGQCIHIYMDYKHTTLTLNPNGGSINGSTEAQALSPQLQYSTSQWNNLSTKEPSRAGYTFTGWYDAPTGGTKVYDKEGACIFGTQYFDGNGKCLCTKDLTLYAHWDVIPYKINTILLGGVVSGIPKTYTIEDDFILPNASLSGFDFSGWTMSCKQGQVSDNGIITRINVTTPTKPLHIAKGTIGDITVTANYTKVNVNSNSNEHNKTPDDDGSSDHITDTGNRKTPLVTDGGTKHNMFRVTQTLR